MAISTYQVELHNSETGTGSYTKFCDVKDFPDLGGDPELLETTTLSDKMQTYIEGIQASEMLAFTVNHTLELMKKVTAMKGKVSHWKLKFSDGSTFTWSGTPSYKVSGEGVNAVINGVINIVPNTEIVMGEDA